MLTVIGSLFVGAFITLLIGHILIKIWTINIQINHDIFGRKIFSKKRS